MLLGTRRVHVHKQKQEKSPMLNMPAASCHHHVPHVQALKCLKNTLSTTPCAAHKPGPKFLVLLIKHGCTNHMGLDTIQGP